MCVETSEVVGGEGDAAGLRVPADRGRLASRPYNVAAAIVIPAPCRPRQAGINVFVPHRACQRTRARANGFALGMGFYPENRLRRRLSGAESARRCIETKAQAMLRSHGLRKCLALG